MPTIEHPSIEQVEFYLKAWDEQENYVLQERSLDKLFKVSFPYNKARANSTPNATAPISSASSPLQSTS